MAEAISRTTVDPGDAFQQSLDLAWREAELIKELADTQRARGVLQFDFTRGTDRSASIEITDPTARLQAGVVLNRHSRFQSAHEIHQTLARLTALNDRIEAGSGELALWLSSSLEEGLMRVTHRPEEYEVVNRVGLGMLASDACIEVSRDGEFSVPLVSGYTSKVQAFGYDDRTGEYDLIDPSDPFGVFIRGHEEPGRIDRMRIETANGDLGRFVLVVGEAEIHNALESGSTPDRTRTHVEGLMSQYTVQLF